MAQEIKAVAYLMNEREGILLVTGNFMLSAALET